MTLTGSKFWLPLIWMLIGGGLLSVFIPKKRETILGVSVSRWRWTAAVILAVPYVLWTGYRSNSFGDTHVYRLMFENVPSSLSALPAYLSEETKDKGYTVLQTLFKVLIGNSTTTFFLIVGVFQIFCVVYVYRKYSVDFWTSFFIFVASTDYFSWCLNGMRQFIVAAGILLCFGLMVRKKYYIVIPVILLLSTIHQSALIMIPIMFIIQGKAWNKRTIAFILAVGLAILYLGRFTEIMDQMLSETQYSDILTNEVWVNDDGENILRVLVYSVPAILSFLGRRKINRTEDPVLNAAVNASICSAMIHLMAWASSGIYVGRLGVYVSMISYIALPWLIKNLFNKDSAILIKAFMIIGYSFYFFIQMRYGWGIL